MFFVLLSQPHKATIADPNASGGIINDDGYRCCSEACSGARPCDDRIKCCELGDRA